MKKCVVFLVITIVSVLVGALIVFWENKKYSDGFRDGWRNAVLDIYFDVGWTALYLAVDKNDLGEEILSWCDAGYHYISNAVTHQCTSKAIVYNVRHDVIVCKDHKHCYASSNLVTGVINHYNPKGEK